MLYSVILFVCLLGLVGTTWQGVHWTHHLEDATRQAAADRHDERRMLGTGIRLLRITVRLGARIARQVGVPEGDIRKITGEDGQP